jgi:hypothetical protein
MKIPVEVLKEFEI